MIILITTRGHNYTFRSILEGKFGCPTPMFATTEYEQLFRAGPIKLPRATYIFSDLDRLAPWELLIAGRLYRAMTEAGLRCLNDPVRVMSRVELLTSLHAAGINPFTVFRADTNPRPDRFPVFVRMEDNHESPALKLLENQSQLEKGIHSLQSKGVPRRGMLVVEYAAEPYRDKLWAKWSTWRIGDRIFGEHLLLHDNWVVKDGSYLNLDDAAIADEHDAVSTGRFVDDLRPAFEIGGIEFGRADHAVFAGRTIVYEINTNPFVSRWEADPRPLRETTQRLIRTRIADALAAIDTDERGKVVINGTNALRRP